MKKFGILAAAFAVLASASCMEETIAPEVIEPEVVAGDVASFTASWENYGSDTKTVLVDGCKVEWKAGNEVLVFGKNVGSAKDDKVTGSGTFDAEDWRSAKWFKTQTGGSHVVFNCTDETFSLVQSQEYIMLHPAGGSYYGLFTDDAKCLRFWLADQTATPGTYQEGYGYCAAKASDFTKPVVFKNLLPLLKFTVPASLDGRITKITVEGNNGEKVAGNMICDYTGDTPVVKVFSEFKDEYSYKGGNTSVSLKLDAGMAAGEYYLAIAPKTYTKGLKVTVTYKDSKTSTRSSSSSVELRSGVIYNMGNVGAENYTGPGIALPYVFPFYATAATGNSPKYVNTSGMDPKNGAILPLTDVTSGGVFSAKTNGDAGVYYWSNSWYGQDNAFSKSFTGEDTYFMLTAPLRTSLPATFRVSFGFWVDGTTNALIKDWKVQYSKDNQTWYDGASFEMQTVLKTYSVEITTKEVTFGAGDTLYLRWIPVGNGTTDGKGAVVHFVGGVVITDVISPDSKATGNVYAEDFDRINGGVDYRHAGQTDGTEKLGLLAEIFGDKIENWTAEQKNGLSGSNVVARTGYAQIGYATYSNRNAGPGSATKYEGSLLTPVLTKASGTINLSFKAMCYKDPFIVRSGMTAGRLPVDVTDIVVNIKGAGSFDSASSVTSKTLSGISTSKFDLKTLHIYNSEATTQIEFTSPTGTGKFTRWFLDDICVSKAE